MVLLRRHLSRWILSLSSTLSSFSSQLSRALLSSLSTDLLAPQFTAFLSRHSLSPIIHVIAVCYSKPQFIDLFCVLFSRSSPWRFFWSFVLLDSLSGSIEQSIGPPIQGTSGFEVSDCQSLLQCTVYDKLNEKGGIPRGRVSSTKKGKNERQLSSPATSASTGQSPWNSNLIYFNKNMSLNNRASLEKDYSRYYSKGRGCCCTGRLLQKNWQKGIVKLDPESCRTCQKETEEISEYSSTINEKETPE